MKPGKPVSSDSVIALHDADDLARPRACVCEARLLGGTPAELDEVG
jgi:hypothetical protein